MTKQEKIGSVDGEERGVGAKVIEGLLDGTCDEQAFRAEYPHAASDPAVREIGIMLDCWLNDFDKWPIPLSKEPQLADFAHRCELFLKTDLEWPWPIPSRRWWVRFGRSLANIATLGVLHRILIPWGVAKPEGLWPFKNKQQLDSAANGHDG